MGAIAGIIILGLLILIATGTAIGCAMARALAGLLAAGGLAVLLAGGLVLLFALGGEVSVPVNTTGVPQAFGTVSGGELQPGVHWTWQPWLSVTDIDETVQTTPFTGKIRIGGQQTAQANIKLKWRIWPSAADSLFRQYANQGPLMKTITANVVKLDLENVVNNVLGDYNPITDQANVARADGTRSLFTTFGPTIVRDMRADIGSEIDILQITMPNVAYAPAIEAGLQQIQQAYTNDAIAKENVAVNTQKALALRKLGTPTLGELIAQCITQATASPGQCIPGSVSKIALSQVPQG